LVRNKVHCYFVVVILYVFGLRMRFHWTKTVIVLVSIVITLLCCVFVSGKNSTRTLLQQWARDRGYEILHKDRRLNYLLNKRPFNWTTSSFQRVYYLELRAETGQLRNAWVRVGGWWGTRWDQIEVRWEDDL